jgi:hypothetical protein
MIEEWKAIPGWPEYEASSLGNIRRVAAAQGAKVGRVLKQQTVWNGYKTVNLSSGGKVKGVVVHRLVLLAFHGLPADGQEALHADDVKDNNQIGNLRWGTHAENYEDRRRHGGGNHGSRHGLSKLDETSVLQIRSMRGNGATHKAIAERFGVSRECIGLILRNERWTHV